MSPAAITFDVHWESINAFLLLVGNRNFNLKGNIMAAQDYEQVTYNEKIGFFGATPVVQVANVVDATDAATAITKLNQVIAGLETLGLFASS